jgi:hypothetical protein
MFGALCFGQAYFGGATTSLIFPGIPSGLAGTVTTIITSGLVA